ncbi:MAG: hypothetical protein ACRETH_01650 [Steroidobacteraceae bacterium]
MLELDCGAEFDAAREEEFFAALPARPAVYAIQPRDGRGQPFLSRTADLRRSAERLLRAPEAATKRLNLRAVAARIRYRIAGSRFEQSLTLYQTARKLSPRHYRGFLRLRPAALLKVNLRNEYPRCYITRRILSDGGFYVGPFHSRKAAESFANEFLDLFHMRRCQIKIRRDPTFPGCIYSEMKMCPGPCFAGCTREEYDAEAERAVRALDSAAASVEEELEREREAASAGLDFERASAIHRKLEKARGVLRGLPEIARRADRLEAVILQRAAEEDAVAVFVVRGGIIADPFVLRFAELSAQPRSVEEMVRENLQSEEARAPETEGNYRARYAIAAPAAGTLEEHLWLLARWYYSKPREGEIFFPAPAWPYRRIVRACSRLLAPGTA